MSLVGSSTVSFRWSESQGSWLLWKLLQSWRMESNYAACVFIDSWRVAIGCGFIHGDLPFAPGPYGNNGTDCGIMATYFILFLYKLIKFQIVSFHLILTLLLCLILSFLYNTKVSYRHSKCLQQYLQTRLFDDSCYSPLFSIK